MRRSFSFLFMLLFLLGTLSACGEGVTPTSSVDMIQLQKTLLEADPSLPDMLSITDAESDAERLFAYVSDLDYEKVEGFLLSYSAEGKADEIAVIEVKDAKDISEAADSLRDHLQDRQYLFDTYTPDEAMRAAKGIICTKDQYAALIICDDGEAVQKAMMDYLSAAAKG